MEDHELIAMVCARNEAAIAETDAKYGQALRRIAAELLGSREDAEETVSDVLLTAWNAVPAEQPVSVFGYLAAVTRHLSMKRLDARNAQRRGGGQRPAVLDELAECVAAPDSVEQEINKKLLWEAVNRFLAQQPEAARNIFLLRYTLAMPVKDIAARMQTGVSAVKLSLYRTRKKLKVYLKKEEWL